MLGSTAGCREGQLDGCVLGCEVGFAGQYWGCATPAPLQKHSSRMVKLSCALQVEQESSRRQESSQPKHWLLPG